MSNNISEKCDVQITAFFYMKKALDKASDTGVTLNAAILFSIYFSFERKSLTNKPKVLKYKASVWKCFFVLRLQTEAVLWAAEYEKLLLAFSKSIVIEKLIDLFSGR